MTTQKFVWQKTRKTLALVSLVVVSLLSPLSAFATTPESESPESQKPSIHLEKSASPTSLPAGGGNVTYTYTVTNGSAVPLSNVVVTDDKCSPVTYVSGDTDSDGKLDKNEVWKFQCKQNIKETTTNTAVVNATWDGGKKVSDTAQATVTVKDLPPPPPPPEEELDIHVEKDANPSTLPAGGGMVTYTYVITNEGNQPLSEIVVKDNKCSPLVFLGGDTDGDKKLDVKEEWKYECKQEITKTTTNAVVASGGKGDKRVYDSATKTVIVKDLPPPEEELDIHVEKDANPMVLPAGGGMVTYTYEVTNVGDQPLSEIVVKDNKCSPLVFLGGDTDGDKKLDVEEKWKYECKQEITKTTTNAVVASGGKGDKRVYDSATKTVFVKDGEEDNHGINIEKSANPGSLPAGGGSVTYNYVVTNTGNKALTNVSVTDDKCSPVNFVSGDTDSDSQLDVGETWKYNCTMNLTATTTNVATAKSILPNDKVVSDTASATVQVAVPQQNPAINIIKSGNVSSLPAGGGSVIYTYWVSNLGNAALSNISVIDNRCSPVNFVSGDSNSNSMLDTNEVWHFQCSQFISTTTTNTATASGVSGNTTVTDQASFTVTVGTIPPPPPPPSGSPAIHIVKSASPSSLPAGGGNVMYDFTVTNIGNLALGNVSVFDDKCAPVFYLSGDGNLNGFLDFGESWNYRCQQTLTASTTNVGTARGTGTNGAVVSDTDTAMVTVGTIPPPPPPPSASIQIEKLASPGSLPAGGGEVTYHFAVSNLGNTAISNVLVTDTKCSPVFYVSGDNNANGLLDTNEMWNYQCSSIVTESLINVAQVTGMVNGVAVSDRDTAAVVVGGVTPPPPPPPSDLPATGQGGAENNSLGITLSALIAMAAFLGIVGISLFSQEQEKRLKR